MANNLKDEYIREAAYFMWEKDGCPATDGFEYWVRAKEELSKACDKTSCKCSSSTSKSSVKKTAVKKISKPALKFATKLKK